ncbi:MAG: DUF4870 domain-containing protein [Actinomycetota bacterium]
MNDQPQPDANHEPPQRPTSPQTPSTPTPPPAPQVPSYPTPPAGWSPPPAGGPGYGAPPPGPGYAAPGGQMSPSDQRTWALLAHLSVLILWFIGPLVIYLVCKDRGPFTRRHSANALNFQIILTIFIFVNLILMPITFGIWSLIGGPLIIISLIGALVTLIMGAVAANQGQEYKYPLTPSMVS